ncbi:MAG: peptidylprolyl isomerase [Candidatus Paceibacterota bacterium]
MKATIQTNKGNIVLELFAEQTPKTAGNFAKLAKEGFYDGTKFHRVIDGFMIQGGDPQTKDDSLQMRWGTGGPGYQFEDEIVAGLSNVVGTISMANAGPNTNGSQFFINVGDNTFLDGKHAVFGKVIEGMDIVMMISQVQKNERDVPVEAIVLEKVTVE